MIVACGKNNVIGKDNKLLWHMPNDLRFFKKKTTGHHLIMGRKTFESCGGPLPDRTNIVITRVPHYKAPGCLIAHSFEEALDKAKADEKPFIIGGEQIYRLGMEKADRIYLTRIHQAFEGDAFFPEPDSSKWTEVSREDHQPNGDHPYPYSFIILERRDAVSASP